MKRKLTTILLALVIVLTVIPIMMTTASAADGYSGTAVTPQVVTSTNYAQFGLTAENWSDYNGFYAITTAEELYGFADIVNKSDRSGTGANAFLANDIVVNTGTVTKTGSSSGTTHEWIPIAKNFNNDYNYYVGTFDGRGYTISGLYTSNADAKPVGLFAAVGQMSRDAVIKNVTIANSYFTGAGTMGAIVGHTQGSVTISNCKVASDVVLESTGTSLGGIMGGSSYGSDTTILNCVTFAKIEASGWRNVGAVVGTESCSPSNCYYQAGDLKGVGYGTHAAEDYGTTGLSSTSAEHNCIGMEHPMIPATCEKTGMAAYSDCMVCGAVLSGSKTVLPLAHNWNPATCTTLKTCVACKTTEGTFADHSYMYSVSSKTIIETCTGDCGHRATVTLNPLNGDYPYNFGAEITPVTSESIVYEGEWKGSTPTVTYQNNVNVGAATAFLSVGGAEVSRSFSITALSLDDATVTFPQASYPYVGAQITPAPIVTLSGKPLSASEYDVTYADNLVPGTATVTLTGKNNFTGTTTATFTVVKGTIVPLGVVTVNVPYGANYRNSEIDVAVVIEGTDTVVRGTWSWTNGDMKANFVPDADFAEYVNGITNQSVSVKEVPAVPTVTVSTSYSSVIAGQTVTVEISAENPHDPGMPDLPSDFTLRYRIGTDGVEFTVSGNRITVPVSAASGDVIYIYATSHAVDGRYTEGVSEKLAVTVKSVQEVVDEALVGLDILRADLMSLIDEKADAATLNRKVEELNEKIIAAQSAAELYAKEYTDEEITALEESLTEAIAAASNAASTALEQAKRELQALIGTNTANIAKNAEEIAKQVGILTEAIANAETAAKQYADSKDAEQYETVTADIANAKQEAVNAAQTALNAVEEKLTALINTNKSNIQKNADEIVKQVGILTEMIELAEQTAKDYADDMDAALYETVTEDIAAAKQEAIDVAQTALDAVEKVLRELIAEGDKANADEIVKQVGILTEMIALAEQTAKEYADEMDAILKEDVYKKIEKAKNYAMLAADEALKEARKDLTVLIEKGDKAAADELSAATDTLNAAIDAAEKAASDADAAQKATLEDSIAAARKEAADADAALKALLEGEIERVKTEAKAELDAAVKTLNTTITVLGIVAGLAFVGVVVLAILYFVPKKKV